MNSSELKEQLMEMRERCACSHLRKAARKVTGIYDEELECLNLKITQLGVLMAVGIHEPLGISALAESQDQDVTGMSRNVRILVKNGLLDYKPSSDKRRKLLVLTKQGRDVVRKSIEPWKKAQEKIDTLYADSYTQFIQSVKKINDISAQV